MRVDVQLFKEGYAKAVLFALDHNNEPVSVSCHVQPIAPHQPFTLEPGAGFDAQPGPASLAIQPSPDATGGAVSYAVLGTLDHGLSRWLLRPHIIVPGMAIYLTRGYPGFLLQSRAAAEQYLQENGWSHRNGKQIGKANIVYIEGACNGHSCT
ncbi:MAG: hypothetical protein H3C34_01640 [Caldilineaceae bacterium]|nr:hypothetical protein [Caldilineaceae bacterium]